MTDAKDWALNRLEKFAIYVCSSAIAFCSWMMWEQHKLNVSGELRDQKIMQILDQLQRHDAQQDQQISEIKGQMVGWDTLKRIELFLGSQPSNKRGEMLGNAIKMERESREK
jgi:epoxyqueuosine reductase QueG